MPFQIQKFKNNVAKFGYLDNNSYEVFVQPPLMFQNQSINNQGTPELISQTAENMAFRIDQVRVPGIALMSADVNRYGIGPTQKQIFNAQFQESSISVLGDHQCEFWRFWYNWTRAIFGYNGANPADTPTYESEYKDNYSTTISIFIYDHFGNIVQKVHLFEAFPTSIREFPLAWGDPNLFKINVSIAYTEYMLEGTGLTSERSAPPAAAINGGQQLPSTGSLGVNQKSPQGSFGLEFLQ